VPRRCVYLDHAASSPVVPEALAAMNEWMAEGFGNPSGAHSVARRARAKVDDARDIVAEFVGVAPAGIVFTSGGTEADNLAVIGSVSVREGAVVVGATEHPAVVEAAHHSGRETRTVPVDADGGVDPAELRSRLGGPVAVVSFHTANNETGVILPIPALARRVHKWAPGAVLHTDAVQAAPWLDLATATEGADIVTISGHKIGGPQGVGALGLRNGTAVAPVLRGGGQEGERRSGTHNVAGIVGLAAAVLALDRTAAERTARRRDRLAELIRSGCPGAVETAPAADKLPGHCHFQFPDVESEALIFLLDQAGVCASAGSACASGAIEPSPVLLAMGVAKEDAAGSLRLTLGPATTDEDVEVAGTAVVDAVQRLRA
jgi:cysteine desulfurase